MNVPVPRNRLVALTLVGVLLTGLVSVTLAAPDLLPGDGNDAGSENSNALASDAPTPNENFTPAVQTERGDGYEEDEEHEGEEREEHDEDEEYGDGEREEDDDEEYGDGEREEHEGDD